MATAVVDMIEPTAMRTPSTRSISIVVTAMNEEGNLEAAVDAVVRAVAPRIPTYEVIIVDDGSTDRTPAIAAALAAANPRIRVHRSPSNLGLGRAYRLGIDLASCEDTSWVAGNGLVPREALEAIFDRVGERDMVISYIIRDARAMNRRLVSRTFTLVMNLLFSVNMRYYTGPCVFKTAVAKQLPARADGSLYVAELLVRLLRVGQSYVEVGLQPLPRASGSTKTFRLRNVLDVFASVLRLFWELRVQRPIGLAHQRDVRLPENDPAVRSR